MTVFALFLAGASCAAMGPAFQGDRLMALWAVLTGSLALLVSTL